MMEKRLINRESLKRIVLLCVDSFIFKSVYIGVVSLLFIFGCRSGDTQRQASHGTNVKE